MVNKPQPPEPFSSTPLTYLRCRLFVVNGIISLPVAISGFVLLPDVPEIAKPIYLTKEVRTR